MVVDHHDPQRPGHFGHVDTTDGGSQLHTCAAAGRGCDRERGTDRVGPLAHRLQSDAGLDVVGMPTPSSVTVSTSAPSPPRRSSTRHDVASAWRTTLRTASTAIP